MRILITISDPNRLALVVDLEAGTELHSISTTPELFHQEVQGRPACRPFGITWSADELFIANNKQLLVFGSQFELVRILRTPLQGNTHQLSYHSGRVWAVSPWTNSIIGVSPADTGAVEFDLLTHTLYTYVTRDGLEEHDKCHFNSLLWAGDSLFVGAHSFGASSFILEYDAESFRLMHLYRDVGASLHGLARHGHQLFWISTKTRQVRSDGGYRLTLAKPGYARGLAMTDRYFIVATSEFLARGNRRSGDSWVQVIDRSHGVVEQEVHLLDTGSINDLRLLDEHDYAHGLEPLLWAQELGKVTPLS